MLLFYRIFDKRKWKQKENYDTLKSIQFLKDSRTLWQSQLYNSRLVHESLNILMKKAVRYSINNRHNGSTVQKWISPVTFSFDRRSLLYSSVQI